METGQRCPIRAGDRPVRQKPKIDAEIQDTRRESAEERYRIRLLPCGYTRGDLWAGRILGVLIIAGAIMVVYLIHTHVGPATSMNPS